MQCIHCQKEKKPQYFCDASISAKYYPEGGLLCGLCLRVFAVKANKKRHYRKAKYRLSRNVRTGIYKSLRTGKPGLWEERVGYTFTELIKHIEKQFTEGMNWNNYRQWQIDHVRPVAFFDFDSYEDDDFRACWALSNLRPLWATENWKRPKQLSEKSCF